MKLFTFNRLIVVILLSAVVFGMFGCSASPEAKAAKDAEKTAEKALLTLETTGDYEKALKEIKKATALASKAKTAGEATLIVAGNLNYDYADQLQFQLAENAELVSDIIDKLSKNAANLNYMQIEKNHLQSLIDFSDERIDQLEDLIAGSKHGPGIDAELKQVQQQLSRLQNEQKQFIAEERQVRAKADQLHAVAIEKLNASKQAQGDDKIQMEEEYYQLIHDKDQYLALDAQAALDKVKEYQSQIDIVEPLVQKLQNDKTDVQRKIDDLDGSPQRSELKRQIRDNDGIIDSAQGGIGQLTNAIKNAQGEYEKTSEKMGTLIDEALKNFKKIKSRANRDISSARKADSFYAAAKINLSAVNHYQNIGLRLQAISSSIAGRSAGSVDRLAIQYTASADDKSKKAMEQYDNAIKEFKSLQKTAARGKDEMACSITKTHILALLEKISLAEQFDKYELVEEAADAVNELAEKAAECDPDFAQSVTFKLFDGQTDIIPAMSVEKEPEIVEKAATKKSTKKKSTD